MNRWEDLVREMTDGLRAAFGARLCYVGLQGSYLRGEAKPGSDLDLMVVIDGLTPHDLEDYRACLARCDTDIPSCGFLCGREELSVWNPLEILHVLHSTKDIYGSIAPLLPAVTVEDHRHFMQLSLGNLYHALCHRYVHTPLENSRAKLGMHEKELFFLLQDLHFLRTGVFAPNRAALYDALPPRDRAVWDAVTSARDAADTYDFDAAFAAVFSWCQDVMREITRS